MNQIRIIGGKWRGKKITFPDEALIRPTPDRVRETVFNWLSPHLFHARCLDLFAGSGALGFEALSRGAAEVILVDQSAQVVTSLKKMALSLNPDAITIYRGVVPQDLPIMNTLFDIIFLDPPYHQNLLVPTCQCLLAKQMLSAKTLVYMEWAAEDNDPLLQLPGWRIHRQQRAGQVVYGIYQVTSFAGSETRS